MNIHKDKTKQLHKQRYAGLVGSLFDDLSTEQIKRVGNKTRTDFKKVSKCFKVNVLKVRIVNK